MNILDLNAVSRPTLTLVMKDEKKTKIHVTTPTALLVERLNAMLPTLTKVLERADEETSHAVYTLAADLINCNLDGISVSAVELLEKYEMNLSDLIIFYSAYEEFITDIENAKN